MLKFSKTYYDKYQVNVKKYRTLPALTFAMFSSNLYDEDNSIKMVRGRLEKDIRTSYFGGNVDVFLNEIIGEAFYYDMNSPYPFAMLNDMPEGNPVLTKEIIINNLFGFAYGEIIPPSDRILKIVYIQKRKDDRSV
jgi:DNA polymerase family B